MPSHFENYTLSGKTEFRLRTSFAEIHGRRMRRENARQLHSTTLGMLSNSSATRLGMTHSDRASSHSPIPIYWRSLHPALMPSTMRLITGNVRGYSSSTSMPKRLLGNEQHKQSQTTLVKLTPRASLILQGF